MGSEYLTGEQKGAGGLVVLEEGILGGGRARSDRDAHGNPTSRELLGERPQAFMAGGPGEAGGGDESDGSGCHRGAIAKTEGGEMEGRAREGRARAEDGAR